MRRIFIALTITLASSQSFAINRYHVKDMTPDQIQYLIQNERRVILWYPPANPKAGDLFGIFVSDASGCGTGQTAASTSIPVNGTSVSALVCVAISSPDGGHGGASSAGASSSGGGGGGAGGGSAGAGGGGGGGGAGGGGGGMPL